MSIFVLKIIALSTMIVDHYGAIFQSGTDIYRIIGRISFPIYCFLLVEGYFHTSNVKKYMSRLLIFAFISEIPFDLAFYNKIGFVHQNIFFTLFLGLLAIFIIDNKNITFKFKNIIIPITCLLAIILAVDYNVIGIIYILSFYYTKKYKTKKRFFTIGVVMFVTNLGAYILQQYSLLALPIISLYNGKLGAKNKLLQISFYVAYPLHLILFYTIKA